MTSPAPRKKIAIVLSGSGIRGVAGIALKEVFEQHNWPIDLIVGSGGGAVAAALWASGFSAKQMLKISQQLTTRQLEVQADLRTFFTFFHHPLAHVKKSHALLKPQPLLAAYRKTWGTARIEDLPIKLLLSATDVDTSQAVMLAEGEVATAVYASRATLPFYPAIELNGRWLVDGIFSRPLPLELAVENGADIIIALNCEMSSPENPDNFLAFYTNFVAQATSVAHRAENPMLIDFHQGEIMFITVHVENLGSAVNWEELNKVLAQARNTIKNHITHLDALLNLGKSVDIISNQS